MAELTNHDDCECPVCQEDYVDPKLLRCGHIICRQCVLKWLEIEGQQNGCPLCRAEIVHSDKAFSEVPDLSALIDSLPTDVAMISMVECKQLLKGDHVCCVCEYNTSASTVCMDCNIKLCQSCSKSHRKVPALREHVLEELSTLTPERLAALRKSSCDVHKELPAELYCLTHQSLVCLVCSSSTHRSCRGVTVLSDFANSKRQTLQRQCERLRTIKASLEKQMVVLEQNVQDIQAQSNVSKNEVTAICDRLKQLVNKHCQALHTRVEAESQVIVSKVKSEKSILNKQLASVAAHVFVADRLLTTAADGSLVKTLPNVNTSMSALESQNVVQSPVTQPDFRFHSEMLSRLEKAAAVFEKSVSADSDDESNQLIPEDTLKDIKERLGELLDMPEFDICQIEECMDELRELFEEHEEQRMALADAVYYQGYPILLAKLLKKLSAMEFNDDVWSLVKSTYSVLWNYSDEGDKLAKGLADAGLVSTLTSNLSCKKYIKALDDENVYTLLRSSIYTLHNIARWSEVTHYFKKCKTHEVMKPFHTLDDTKYSSLKVSATVTSVYTATSEGILQRIADKDVINNIVSWLENAMESDNNTFEYFAPFEFAQALVKLADNDSNKLKIVEAGALPLLLNLLQQDDVRGQAMGAKCLWTLCFNLKARQQIIEFPELTETLETLTESEFPDVRVNAAFALWAIKDDGCF